MVRAPTFIINTWYGGSTSGDAKYARGIEVTPLHAAAQNVHRGVKQKVYGAAADFTAKDGATPLSVALKNGHVSVTSALNTALAQNNRVYGTRSPKRTAGAFARL